MTLRRLSPLSLVSSHDRFFFFTKMEPYASMLIIDATISLVFLGRDRLRTGVSILRDPSNL